MLSLVEVKEEQEDMISNLVGNILLLLIIENTWYSLLLHSVIYTRKFDLPVEMQDEMKISVVSSCLLLMDQRYEGAISYGEWLS